MASTKITQLAGRRVWDSRGRPTVEAEVILSGGATGRAIAPAGAGHPGKLDVYFGCRWYVRLCRRANSVLKQCDTAAFCGIDIRFHATINSS